MTILQYMLLIEWLMKESDSCPKSHLFSFFMACESLLTLLDHHDEIGDFSEIWITFTSKPIYEFFHIDPLENS